jgi:Mn2+/Fe2+ NRAMP family transporter
MVGPGMVAMLAGTDVGSIVTAAQSGARWGYRLLALQFALVPVLFVVQELTVRLGLVTGHGQAALIRRHFGRHWTWLAMAALAIGCFGALVTQLSGLAAVGALLGVPAWLAVALAVGLVMAVVLTGSYRSVERTALGLGLFELAFLVVAWRAAPDPRQILAQLLAAPIHRPGYLYLVAANIGACIMPWMVFYQQAAVVDKSLHVAHLRIGRWDTAIGALTTQVITAAILAAAAATIGRGEGGVRLVSISDIATALTGFLGRAVGVGLFAVGMTGAALIAIMVLCLAAAWTIGEVFGARHSLEDAAREAPWFYGAFATMLVVGGGLVASGVDLVGLAVAVEVVNAFLLPILLTFLFLLCRRALPEPHRLAGPYAGLVGCVMAVTAGVGVCAGLIGAAG